LRLSLVICTLLTLFACKELQEDGKVVATAYGYKLYEDEVTSQIPDDVSFEDSVFIAQEVINLWVEKHVLINEANRQLTEEEKDKSEEIEQYKNDLLIYEVLNKLSSAEVDTVFSDVELEEYYNQNIEDFELQQNIIKVIFYKIPSNTPRINKLWADFEKDFASAHEKLQKIADKKGNSYTKRNSWVLFDDILKEVPINTYNQEHFLSNNKNIRLKDGSYEYFIKIVDFQTRSGVKPFSLAKEDIKPVLLMKRQKELVKTIETKLIRDAYSSNKVKVY
jgi:hypothetical protein